MKKNVMCIALAAILLVMAIPAFAATNVYRASYSAGKVNHRFDTTKSISKSSSETWILIKDNVTYSYYCDGSVDVDDDPQVGAHTTCLVSGTGTVLSTEKTATGNNSNVSFAAGELGKANNAAAVKLRIKNPKYGTNENLYLKTAGSFQGTAKSGDEESSISPDLY